MLSDGTDSEADEIRFYLDGSISSKRVPKDTPIWTKISFETDTVGGSFDRGNIEVVVFSKSGVVFVDDMSVKVDGKEVLQNGGFEK